ncbi:MAG TPA: hypothetical protein DDY16_05480 [Tenacibaculum sp.]|nr:hypothetical protein [Tenacibaculum sp.]
MLHKLPADAYASLDITFAFSLSFFFSLFLFFLYRYIYIPMFLFVRFLHPWLLLQEIDLSILIIGGKIKENKTLL